MLRCAAVAALALSLSPALYASLPASSSDTADSEAEALQQIFAQQLELLDTLNQHLNELEQQNKQLQTSLDESQKLALRASRATLQQQKAESKKLDQSLGESKQARQALDQRLKESASSLNAAQASVAPWKAGRSLTDGLESSGRRACPRHRCRADSR